MRKMLVAALMAAGLASVITATASAKNDGKHRANPERSSPCVIYEGETYCVAGAPDAAKDKAVKVHKTGDEVRISDHAKICPLGLNHEPIPADGQEHIGPCKSSPGKFCMLRCEANGPK